MRGTAAVTFVAAVLAVAVACMPQTGDGAERMTLADGSTALQWGNGEYGVVLVPDEGESPEDWSALATEIAANRMTIVAVDAASVTPDRLAAAADWLLDQEIERVAYIGSGGVGGLLLAAAARSGLALDQVVVISGSLTDDSLADLGEPPKLFVAAEGDEARASEATRMAAEALGSWNGLLLVPGSDRGPAILDSEGATALIGGVLARLEERR